MHLFLLCLASIYAQDIYLNVKSANYTVYTDGKVKDEFNLNILGYGQTCNPPQSFSILEAKSNYGQTNQTLQINNVGDEQFQVVVIQEENNEAIETWTDLIGENNIVQPKQSINYLLRQQCPSKETLNSHNYWVAITIKVTLIKKNETINEPFVIVFSCDKSFRALTFDWSLVILLIISTTLIAFLAKHTRIQSFRWKLHGQEFQGFTIDYSIISIYIGIYSVGAGIILGSDFIKVANYSLIIVACILGTFGIFFAASEVACLGKASSWVRRYRIVVATSVTILIAVPYYFFQPWYLSDIMSMTFILLIVKFFRLKNFKYATILMAANVIMDVTVSLVIHYTQYISYNTLTLDYLNCPLELQLPLITLQFNKNCAWIALFSQAIPGLILSLAYRLDESKRTFAYGLAGFCSLIFAEGLWVLTTVSITHSIPQTVFTYPILLFTLALISFRRAEFKSFWQGDYLIDFDYYRTKIRGDSLQNVPQLRLLSGLDSIPDFKQNDT